MRAATTRMAFRAALLCALLCPCPATFAAIGTEASACVGVTGTVEEARVTLGVGLTGERYEVWRSRDGPVSVFDWVAIPAGHVYVRVQPDPDGRAQPLVYLDVPPDRAVTPGSGTRFCSVTRTPPDAEGETGVSSTPAVPTTGTVGRGTVPIRAVGPADAPVPFRRTLDVRAPRMDGQDVLAVQERPISLMRPARQGRGAGWFGLVMAAAVSAFHGVNRITWDTPFSDGARPHAPPVTP